MNPLVSVVVAIYNVRQYLPQCIQSIINQDYSNIEIILVDDGSTDGSELIVDCYAKQEIRINVIHQQNGGPSICRNSGINAASGEFITFVDGDDWLAEDFVSYMMHVQSETNTDMVISRNCFTTDDKQQIKHHEITTLSSEEATAILLYPTVKLGAWNKLYKLEFLTTQGIRFVPSFRAGEGLEFITHAASLAGLVGMGNRKVYYYRLDNINSATSKPSIENQGIGSILTIQYITDTLQLRTQKVERALNWRRWSSYGYCLRQIVSASAKKQYPELYTQCIRYRRANAPKQLFADLSARDKLLAILVAISPVAVARLSLTNIRYASHRV